MPDGSTPEVCVVTQPARRQGGKTHSHQLLDILAEITTVSLITANLDPNASVRDDHEVTEVTTRGTGESLPVVLYRFVKNQFLMMRAIARRDEEIVLFFGATAYLLPMIACQILGKTVVVEPRGDVPESLRLKWDDELPSSLARFLAGLVRVLENAGYVTSDAIVAYSPSMAAELGLERYQEKLYAEGARYVDTNRFSVSRQFADRPMTVGYIGRLDAQKGIPTLVEVAKRLPDDVRFRFVGDGDYRDQVERELSDEIESGAVEMVGWVDHDEVPRELNRLQLALLASEMEGLPTIILESFACGTPVYAPPVSGIPDLVREDETGFLMAKRDPDEIVATIERAVTNDELGRMSDRCRSVAETEFSFDAAVDRYRHILESIAGRSA